MRFTLFVILPNTNDVCTLRHVHHGTTIREIRCRLEIEAGLPAQIYRLHNSDGQYMHEEHCLLLDQNVWDGFILRTQLFESWADLYKNVMANRREQVIQNGAIKLGENLSKDDNERSKVEAVVQERGTVALYVAAFYDLYGMCGSLLQVGVNPNGRTPFGRTPLHAAASRNNDAILDLLVDFKCDIDDKDSKGDTALDLARRVSAKLCSRKLRLFSLDKNGLRPLNGLTNNVVRVKMPSDHRNQKDPQRLKSANQHVPHPPAVRRHEVENGGKRSAIRREEPLARSNSQCFVWDIKDNITRQPSNAQFRVQTASQATRKNGVRWNDTPSLIEIRKPPLVQRGASAPRHPQTILKNRTNMDTNERRSNLIRTLSRESLESNSSTVKSEIAPSQPDSEMTLVSAPGEGSRPSSFDVRSVESVPVMRTQENHSGSSRSKGSIRLLPFRRKQNEAPTSTAKRHIKLAEKQKTKYQPKANAEKFDDWLERKRLEECRERLSSRSGDSSQDSDSDGTESNSRAYKEWMRQRGRRPLNPQREMTVEELYRWNDRPLRGVVMIGQTHLDNADVPAEPPQNHLRSYQKWKQNRPEKQQRALDKETLKVRLEKKRQELLAAAVTYDDWLEHAEEKKLLMKQILKADMQQLEKLEEEIIKKRSPRQISFDKWNVELLKRDMKERKKAEETRQLQESIQAEKMRSSACVTHDIWLNQKRATLRDKQKNTGGIPSQQREPSAKQPQTDVANGRELLKSLREKRRGESSIPC